MRWIGPLGTGSSSVRNWPGSKLNKAPDGLRKQKVTTFGASGSESTHSNSSESVQNTSLGLARAAAKEADRQGDPGTNALLIGEVLKLNELQVWFLAGHLAGRGSVRSEDGVARNAQPPGRAGKSPATSDTGVATRLKHLS